LLGANDGLVSTSALIIGVSGSVIQEREKSSSSQQVVLTGLAGLVAGAMSMAVGEYISVSGQKDSELSDIEKEKLTWKVAGSRQKARKLDTLKKIYEGRGLSSDLALKVAEELHLSDPIASQ
jgi:VIT1/CCC1 family predicted Fe2+/Mn2+ transporter